jgi:predicted ATP-grasp superfamily ATP-dependent carboligase
MIVSNKVFVFGGNHHNTLGVIRSLGIKGIASVLVLVDVDVKRTSYVSKSRYICEEHLFSSYEEGVQYLIETSSFLIERMVIICCSDGAASAVDMHYDVLSKAYYIPNCGKQGEISRLMSKEVLASTAIEFGLNVPKTWVSENGLIPIGVTFPCILKPLYSKDGSKADIQVCDNFDQLNAYFQKVHSDKLQIQAFIEKDFEYQLIGCSIGGGQDVIIPGVSKVIRPSKTSNTGFLYYDKLDDSFPVEKVKQMLYKVKYSGLFSAEFLRDKDGNDFFMEINFRNDGNAIAVTAAGVNLPFIWFSSAYGEKQLLASEIKPVYVMPEFDDMAQMLHGKVSLYHWLRDIHRTDCFMEYDKNDKKPFFYRIGDMFKVAFRKIGHRWYTL